MPSVMPHLAAPDERYKASYISAMSEFHAEGRYDDLDLAWLRDHFSVHVADLLHRAHSARLGRVKETTFWLVEGETYIGRVAIRHALNAALLRFGGHIGYDIRPACRRCGHGRSILRLALPEARKLGLRRVLLTCDSTNEGSRRIIQANGGVFLDETLLAGRDIPTQRWWIDLYPGDSSPLRLV